MSTSSRSAAKRTSSTSRTESVEPSSMNLLMSSTMTSKGDLYAAVVHLKNLKATGEATPESLKTLDWLLELHNYRLEKERELKRFLEETCLQ